MDVVNEVVTMLGGGVRLPKGSPLVQLAVLVNRGVPKASVEQVSKRLPAGTVNSYVRETDKGAKSLSPGDSERIARLAYVLALAHHVWGSWDRAVQFLTHPHERLDRETPLQAATNEWGLREVESLLRSIQFGLPA